MLRRKYKPCKLDGCCRPVYSKGLCGFHYQQQRRAKPPRPSQSTEKKRKRINPVSKKRKEWNALYFAQCEKDESMQRPVDNPSLLFHKEDRLNIQRHHPFRRLKEAILAYVYVTREMHEKIEGNAKWARAEGWIHDRPPDGSEKRPWPIECESIWPEKYKRK